VANSKSAEKRIRVAARNAERNRVYRSSARTLVKRAELAIQAGDQEAAAAAVLRATAALDKTASKKVIHPNNAARRKSRLMAKFNAMGAAGA
jgi:small subunit ribosomal protein S20